MLPSLNKVNVVDAPKMPMDNPTLSFEVVLSKWFGSKKPAQELYTGELFDLAFLVAQRPASGEATK